MSDGELQAIRERQKRTVEKPYYPIGGNYYRDDVAALLAEVERLKDENAGFRSFIDYCRDWMPDFKNWMFNVWERHKATMGVLDTIGKYTESSAGEE